MPPPATTCEAATTGGTVSGAVWPAGVDRPPPREVRLQGESRCLLLLATGILAVLLTAFATMGALVAYRRSLLLTHGVLTDGVVTALSGVDGPPRRVPAPTTASRIRCRQVRSTPSTLVGAGWTGSWVAACPSAVS